MPAHAYPAFDFPLIAAPRSLWLDAEVIVKGPWKVASGVVTAVAADGTVTVLDDDYNEPTDWNPAQLWTIAPPAAMLTHHPLPGH